MLLLCSVSLCHFPSPTLPALATSHALCWVLSSYPHPRPTLRSNLPSSEPQELDDLGSIIQGPLSCPLASHWAWRMGSPTGDLRREWGERWRYLFPGSLLEGSSQAAASLGSPRSSQGGPRHIIFSSYIQVTATSLCPLRPGWYSPKSYAISVVSPYLAHAFAHSLVTKPFLHSLNLSIPAGIQTGTYTMSFFTPVPLPTCFFFSSTRNSHLHLGYLLTCSLSFKIPLKRHLCEANLEFPVRVIYSPIGLPSLFVVSVSST